MKNSSWMVGICLTLAVGTAIAQVAPTLAEQLRSVASYYGDSWGRIPVTLVTGEVKYIATADVRSPYSIYTAGARVADGASLAACGIGSAGEPVACDPAYGEAVIYGMQELQPSQPEPSEMSVECHQYADHTYHCRFTFFTDTYYCFLCSQGHCEPSQC